MTEPKRIDREGLGDSHTEGTHFDFRATSQTQMYADHEFDLFILVYLLYRLLSAILKPFDATLKNFWIRKQPQFLSRLYEKKKVSLVSLK